MGTLTGDTMIASKSTEVRMNHIAP
jgi:hypothetical protein